MWKNTKRHLLVSLAGALLFTLICGSGLLASLDLRLADALYQSPETVSGDIVIIGIDDRAQNQFGPYNNRWDRHIIAQALEVLASDPDKKPAVVAIDALFTEKTTSEADNHLADAASKLYVVTASNMTSDIVRSGDENNNFNTSYSSVTYHPPYDLIRQVAREGHINATLDEDGFMRHALLFVTPRKDVKVYSMAYLTASAYAQKKNIPVTMPPVDKAGRFYIPYKAKPYGYYDGVSILDLIKGEVPADYYAGKIVLIGPYSVGLGDQYPTPIDHSNQMFGVEIQANVIESILTGNYKREVPKLLQLGIVFALTFAVLFLALCWPFLISAALCIILAVADIFVCRGLYTMGYVLHPLWFSGAMAVIFILMIIAHYYSTLKQRQHVTSTLERYVAPNIVKELMKEGADSWGLGGKLCDIAVLFVDIRGFTTMSEKKQPEEIVAILNRYLTMTSNCIEQNEGTLDKFIGDATMAFWGAPLPQENAVYLAAKTALDIVEGAKKLSEELVKEGKEELRVGVGVHFGPAVVGNMGSEKHMDYTAVGDTVNTASRLESNAPGNVIYISRAVAEKLGDKARIERLAHPLKLKGKADDFEVDILLSLDGE